MFKKLSLHAAIFLAAFSFLAAQDFILGDEVLLNEKTDLIIGKSIGIVTNTSAILSDGELFIDTILKRKDIKVKSVFALEHGFDLRSGAGTLIEDSYVEQIKVHSLYGKTKKPSPQMLDRLDIVLFDVQDIGDRFYTYISSLKYLIEACGENNVQLIVLDRPNPLGGIYVDGPVLENEFKSFIGIDNIPVVHGMTVGELALFFNDRVTQKADLEIVKMKGWQRTKFGDELNLPWRDPSPNIVNFETVLLYPATVFFEGTNVSEGRGTYTPFNIFGAPFINSIKLSNAITKELGNLFEVRAIEFVPVAIADKAPNPKYKNEICEGVQLILTDRDNYKPVEAAVKLISVIHNLYPDKFEMDKHFDLLWGTDTIRKSILAGKTPDEIINSWQKELLDFINLRNNYLLY